jgi:hypothetical protein
MIRRQDLVEADLRCLMCARVIGRLYGLVWRDSGVPQTTGSGLRLRAFRPSRPDLPMVALTGHEHFRCTDCGGIAVMDEIFVSTVKEVQPTAAHGCAVHGDRARRRGRPPRGCQCGDLDTAA